MRVRATLRLMSAANAQPKRFPLSLTLDRWQRLGAELAAMEHIPHASAIPVEKQLERDRAGEQIQAIVASVLAEHRTSSDAQVVEISLPLGRTTAKYLLTACDRLRRSALHSAWRARKAQVEPEPLAASPAEGEREPGPAGPHPSDAARLSAACSEALSWDRVMRALSMQHGVVHPLPEMVAPLTLGDSELAQIGAPVDILLNGEDLLAQ